MCELHQSTQYSIEEAAGEEPPCFAEIKKDTYEERRGTAICLWSTQATPNSMVRAIHNGVNVKENCVHYVGGMAEEETKKIANLTMAEADRNGKSAAEDYRYTDQLYLSDNIARN